MGYVNVLWNLYKMTRNTKKTRQEIVKLQEKKWRRMVRHAYDASPYYRQTFEAAGITAGNIDSLPLSAFPSPPSLSCLRFLTSSVCPEKAE